MGGKGKILVVDDDRLVLATVTHGLSQAGYDVIDADNGDDAILLAREHKPDLALLDIRMEGKSGFDVADYLRGAAATPALLLRVVGLLAALDGPAVHVPLGLCRRRHGGAGEGVGRGGLPGQAAGHRADR